MAMALLAFAGFLRFDELAYLKLKDLALHDTHFGGARARVGGAP